MIELSEQLALHYPEVPAISPEPLTDVFIDEILEHLMRNIPGSADAEDPCSELDSMRLFVLIPDEHPFVTVARKENQMAQWGIGVPCKFSVAWVDNKFLWWHEALHLFNAKDCYNKFGLNRCHEPNCVMQISPTPKTCGNRLHLCSKNVRRISCEDPSF